MIDLAQIKALAAAASPGPWVADKPSEELEGLHAIRAPNGRIVADVGYTGSLDKDLDNAAFIAAANPAAVLELIALTERLQAELEGQRNKNALLAASLAQADERAAMPAPALTDKQIIEEAKKFGDLWGNSDDNWLIDFARAILAAAQPAPTDAVQAYTDCCDTPHLCSSVRRCTAKDSDAGQAQALVDAELPPLPPAVLVVGSDLNSLNLRYSVDQMHAYGRACMALRQPGAAKPLPENSPEYPTPMMWQYRVADTIKEFPSMTPEQAQQNSLLAEVNDLRKALKKSYERCRMLNSRISTANYHYDLIVRQHAKDLATALVSQPAAQCAAPDEQAG